MILVYLLTSLYLVYCQLYPDTVKIKPEKCYGEDKVMERHCCIFPPFFRRDVARTCGAFFAIVHIDNDNNVTSLKRQNKYECEYWRCLLSKYGMLDVGDKVHTDNYFSHLNRWTSLNPDFSTVIVKGKAHCREKYALFLPLTTCEFFGFQQCIRAFVNVHCPVFIQSKECLEWKEFYEECKEYFI